MPRALNGSWASALGQVMIAFLGIPKAVVWPEMGRQRDRMSVRGDGLRCLPAACRLLVYWCGGEALARGGDVAAAARGSQVPVLAVVPDERLAFDDFADCALGGGDVHALRAGESIEAGVAELTKAPAPAMEGRLLASLAATDVPNIRFLLAAAVLIGRNRAKAVDVSRAVGMPDRTIRRTLQRCGEATPLDLPALCTGAYLAADVQHRRMSVGAVARARGFESTDHLRRYLVARTGASPSEWAAMGFEGAMAYAASRTRVGGENREVSGENSQVDGEKRYGALRSPAEV